MCKPFQGRVRLTSPIILKNKGKSVNGIIWLQGFVLPRLEIHPAQFKTGMGFFFFFKQPFSKYFRVCRPDDLYLNYSSLSCDKAQVYINKQVWLHSIKLYLKNVALVCRPLVEQIKLLISDVSQVKNACPNGWYLLISTV